PAPGARTLPRGPDMGLKSRLFRGDSTLEAAAVSHAAHIVPGAVGEHVRKIQYALVNLDGAWPCLGTDVAGYRSGVGVDVAMMAPRRRGGESCQPLGRKTSRALQNSRSFPAALY